MTETHRAQLEVLDDLTFRSVSEETRIALVEHLEKFKTDPKVLERAAHVREKIEREAATRRGAIDAISPHVVQLVKILMNYEPRESDRAARAPS